LVSSNIPRVLSFTGSVEVGNIITKTAGIKKLALELGGNAATCIDKSADIKQSALRCAYGAFVNSGQVCISLQRIYVNSEVYEEFSCALKEETLKLIVGSPYNEDTFIGPLIDEESLNRAKNWCSSAIDEGAKVLCGNKADGMNFYPTIITDVHDDMNIVCQEVFAPIVSLISVKSYDEAINKMNNSPYGLQFSIFTNDLKQSQNFIYDSNCGGVVINDIPTLRFDIQPYGGTKLSGIGKEGPIFAIEEFTQIKSIVIC
jgi:acyl-CoA reductase-like NAD-dependent aldehyde dehydrogenase